MNSETNHDSLQNECLSLLSATDIELSPFAIAVINFFFSVDSHVALRDFEDYLKSKALPVDIEGVQATMQILEDYGFATRRTFPDGRARYEHLHIGEHHDHLFCLRCGRIIEFFSPDLERLQADMARRNGFHAFSHRLLIRGLCDTCFGKTEPGVVCLAALQPGATFRVERIDTSDATAPAGRGGIRRLSEMGIGVGAEGEVVSNHGIVLVTLGGTRLALGQGQARRIMVTLTN